MNQNLVHLATADGSPPNGHPGSEAWAAQINSQWRKSLEGVVETGRILLEAKASLPFGDFTVMLEQDLDFNPRTAQRLMAIAQDIRLSNPTHASVLPKAWTTLYELTTLSDAEFEQALADQSIHPKMERADVARIKGSDGGVQESPASIPDYNGVKSPALVTAHGLSGESCPLSPIAPDPSDSRPMPHGARAIAPSRHEPEDSLDFFPTPPWATRALIERVLVHLERRGHCRLQTVWEPACGEGHMAEVLTEYFQFVDASDIHDYGRGYLTCDFLNSREHFPDWIITNPPFGDKTEAFVLKALALAGTGVAMFVRLQWLETIGRYERLFRDHPPTLISFFAERVPLHKDQWKPDGDTLTAYIWLTWIKGAKPQAPFWISPGCREALTKSDDEKRFAKRRAIVAEEEGSEAA